MEVSQLFIWSCIICAELFNIYLPTYFGQEIRHESSSVGYAMFESNWPELDVKKKKNILLFVEMTKSPIQLRACYIFEINLENFVFVSFN